MDVSLSVIIVINGLTVVRSPLLYSGREDGGSSYIESRNRISRGPYGDEIGPLVKKITSQSECRLKVFCRRGRSCLQGSVNKRSYSRIGVTELYTEIRKLLTLKDFGIRERGPQRGVGPQFCGLP